MHLFELGGDVLEKILRLAAGMDSPVNHVECTRMMRLGHDRYWYMASRQRYVTTFLPYLLVCKTFCVLLLRQYRRHLVELPWPQNEPDPLPLHIDLIEDVCRQLHAHSEPRLWIHAKPCKMIPFRPTTFEYQHKFFRWFSIRCKNSFHRKLIHIYARARGLYTHTYTLTETYSDWNYHHVIDGYTEMTPCEGCSRCRRYRTFRAGIVISDQPLRIRASANRTIQQLRRE